MTAERGARQSNSVMSTPATGPELSDDLLRLLLSGRPDVPNAVARAASTSSDPSVIVAAALLSRDSMMLSTARPLARTTRDRQLVALAAARIGGQQDHFDVLVREHLLMFPDDLLASWIAGRS